MVRGGTPSPGTWVEIPHLIGVAERLSRQIPLREELSRRFLSAKELGIGLEPASIRRRIHLRSIVQEAGVILRKRAPGAVRHSLRRRDRLADFLHGQRFRVAARPVVVHHDGKHDRLAARRGQIARQGNGFVQRAGLGPQLALEG